jgi:Stage II sporulation protein M
MVDGIRRTRAALDRWRKDPWPMLRGWFGGSMLIAVILLFATWLVAASVSVDASQFDTLGISQTGNRSDVRYLLGRNALVLALHALACVAGFIARSSLPLEAERYAGTWRRMHDKIGTAALTFVAAATVLSLGTQALALGRATAAYSADLDVSPARFLASRLVHALPELMALFLPLAAWLITSRRGQWQDLLAVTFATVAIAAPILVGAAFIEVYVSPHLVPGR